MTDDFNEGIDVADFTYDNYVDPSVLMADYTYATAYDVSDQVSAEYTIPPDIDRLLKRASEIIDWAMLGRSKYVWTHGKDYLKKALTKATCQQVEFWLEVGEEHDIEGNRGSLTAGRLSISHISPTLSPRAARTLFTYGLLWRGVRIR